MTSPNNFSEEAIREKFKNFALNVYNRKWVNPLSAGEADYLNNYWLKVLADYKAHLREKVDGLKPILWDNDVVKHAQNIAVHNYLDKILNDILS